jgi:ubiquinone biosynthesis protein COQ9
MRTTLRPLILINPRPPRPFLPSLAPRTYHTTSPSSYHPPQSTILTAALTHVPTHGFTPAALRLGARDAGYLDATANLFPRGAYELVLFHLEAQRRGLWARVAAKAEMGQNQDGEKARTGVGVREKVCALVLERLRGNVDAGVDRKWGEVRISPFPPLFFPSARHIALWTTT